MTTEASTLQSELRRLDQALADIRVCGAAEVCLVHVETKRSARDFARGLVEHAHRRHFVTAEVSLVDSSFEELADVVRELIEALAPPTRSQDPGKGLLWVLDNYYRRHGQASAEAFEAAAHEHGATGDLTALCLAYLGAHADPQQEVMALEAWLGGTELKRTSHQPIARAALSSKTAKRALSELTRVVRALGYSGCVFYMSDGDVLARRTARQRENAYTVLRELVDNFDSGRGVVSTRVVISGQQALFEGENSLESLAPLHSRLRVPSAAEPPPPHRSWVALARKSGDEVPRGRIRLPDERRGKELAALMRISQGLPPTEGVASLSVGHERIDALVTRMFEHATVAGSVFTVLTGEYGSGKTHLLMHLAERAYAQRHPVFRLDLERLDFDLGNPQRHLGRLLDDSVMPHRHRPSALERASVWTRSPARFGALKRTLKEIEESGAEASAAATKGLKVAALSDNPGQAMESYLGGRDLFSKSASKTYRKAAYDRLLLWVELLRRMDGCQGPVVLIDEAENLYTSAMTRAARRAALRSLAFYCGGALPGAVVVVAITPKVLGELKRDARELLAEISEQSSLLECEDAEMMRRRLYRLQPEPVPDFKRRHRKELVERAMATHRLARGPLETEALEGAFKALYRADEPPRVVLRAAMDLLESHWWGGG